MSMSELEVWGTKLTHCYVLGDLVGNLAVVAHLLLAVIVMLAGSLQLIPQVHAYGAMVAQSVKLIPKSRYRLQH